MIEEETKVKIIFPSSKEDEFITIEGISVDNVTSASEKIQAIIDETVRSRNLDYSHFISLPLAIHPELVSKLVNFQNTILGNDNSCIDENLDTDSNEAEDTIDDKEVDQSPKENADVAVELKVDDDSKSVKVNLTSIPFVSYAPKASKPSASSDLGIDKSIFIKPKTFHLTVLMLKLWNTDRVKTATEVLQSISSKVMEALDNRPLSVRLKGLECMKGSFAKARVLYTPVEEIGNEARLLRACPYLEVIIDAYVEAGLVLENDAKQRLKLHATVMNSRHRKRTKWKRNVDSFDARSIFKQYGSEDWGQYLIREAHLSKRFSFDENGYYHCCASIPFPENMQAE
ncbi:AKAP7 2'5' RNA ligase-like domain protein [Trifolium pratense]|uniref:AKAP7 2'5' RNA ligase-like domain protein n=1 Tax=Trifolium pratense TaxID=57577 RepID=A0A2K3MMN0_TRIPR|nr:AKAP7 2'5' RNA ligase-like domain protein [Trifolium pratense]